MKALTTKLFLILGLFSLAIGCSRTSFIAPSIKFLNFEFNETRGEKITGVLHLEVKNQMDKKLTFKLVECDVSLNDALIGSLSQSEYEQIQPFQTMNIPVDVVLRRSGLISGIFDTIIGKTYLLKARGKLRYKIMGIPFSKHFEEEHQTDLKDILGKNSFLR